MKTNQNNTMFIVLTALGVTIFTLIAHLYFTLTLSERPPHEGVASSLTALSVSLLTLSILLVAAKNKAIQLLIAASMGLLVWLFFGTAQHVGHTNTFVKSNVLITYLAFSAIGYAVLTSVKHRFALGTYAKKYFTVGVPVLAAIIAVGAIWLQVQVNQNYNLQAEATAANIELEKIEERNNPEPAARNETIVTDMRLKANTVIQEISDYVVENGTFPTTIDPPAGYIFTDYRVVSDYKIEICMEPAKNTGSYLPIVVQPSASGDTLYWYDFSSTGCAYNASGYTELRS